MTTNSTENYNETFVYNPNLNEVSELMIKTWTRPCWEYSVDLLASYLDRPEGDKRLSVGYYYDGKLEGYLAYFPYKVKFFDQEISIVYGTWWTVSKECKGRAVALKLQRELQNISRENGYSGFLTVTHEGTHADRAMRFTLQHLYGQLHLINTFGQMMAIPQIVRRRLNGTIDPLVKLYTPAMTEECLVLLKSIPDIVDVAHVFTERDVYFLLHDRVLTRTWVYHDGQRVRALLNIMQKKLLAEKDTVNAYIEHIAINDLTDSMKKAFLSTIFMDPYWDSIDAIYIPNTGYFDQSLLGEIGFYKTLKKFNLYWVPFYDRLSICNVQSFYLNIF